MCRSGPCIKDVITTTATAVDASYYGHEMARGGLYVAYSGDVARAETAHGRNRHLNHVKQIRSQRRAMGSRTNYPHPALTWLQLVKLSISMVISGTFLAVLGFKSKDLRNLSKIAPPSHRWQREPEFILKLGDIQSEVQHWRLRWVAVAIATLGAIGTIALLLT